MSDSSFRRKPPSLQSSLKQFDVGAEEFFGPEQNLPSEIQHKAPSAPRTLTPEERQAYTRSRNNPSGEKLGDYGRKRIEILANIGYLSRMVEIEGVSFALRTLKNKEVRETTLSIFKCINDIDAHYEFRRQTLARSIYQIDNVDVESHVGGSEIELRLEMIDEMEDVTVSKLFTEYNALKQEVQTKYGLATDEQVKEVVADIKK